MMTKTPSVGNGNRLANPPVAIDIRGAKGPNAVTINGVYEPTEEYCNNWPVYRKRGDTNKWLEFFDASSQYHAIRLDIRNM